MSSAHKILMLLWEVWNLNMTLTLREAIVARVCDKNKEDLREIIQDAIGGIEMQLPGIGVLFEMIWSGSGNEEQDRMLDVLLEALADKAQPET